MAGEGTYFAPAGNRLPVESQLSKRRNVSWRPSRGLTPRKRLHFYAAPHAWRNCALSSSAALCASDPLHTQRASGRYILLHPIVPFAVAFPPFAVRVSPAGSGGHAPPLLVSLLRSSSPPPASLFTSRGGAQERPLRAARRPCSRTTSTRRGSSPPASYISVGPPAS